jgi:diaminohydroxyphosphoribosylaminopyrimidine deaminase/5-amino-6-(5-phosphoribosylamino)uracil reductase
MRVALELAPLGEGRTHPNPVVGAVVVKRGRIVGRGFHRAWGLPHAEIEAIRDAGRASRGADLYITLEPCCHHGKTPPCTDAIVASGISRVFAAMLDPNPVVDGRGAAALRRAGVRVDIGLEAQAALRLNEAYAKLMKTGRPFVTVKIAQTLDGKIAAEDGNARWITSAASRRLARKLRARAQALLVGRRTVAVDDPMLMCEPRRSKHYVRCVLDSGLKTPLISRVVRTAGRYPVILYHANPGQGSRRSTLLSRQRRLASYGLETVGVRAASDGRLDLESVLTDLASRQVMHLWVEGGSAVFTSFLRAGLVDRLLLFVAPKVMGGRASLASFGELGVKSPAEAYGLRLDSIECVGDDLLAAFYPRGSAGVRQKSAPLAERKRRYAACSPES